MHWLTCPLSKSIIANLRVLNQFDFFQKPNDLLHLSTMERRSVIFSIHFREFSYYQNLKYQQYRTFWKI